PARPGDALRGGGAVPRSAAGPRPDGVGGLQPALPSATVAELRGVGFTRRPPQSLASHVFDFSTKVQSAFFFGVMVSSSFLQSALVHAFRSDFLTTAKLAQRWRKRRIAVSSGPTSPRSTRTNRRIEHRPPRRAVLRRAPC